ncbi:uncharacterized protein BDZ83DRAFT_10287 [Colletotrichum acutatum]|uniref:Secreted protein n=1 Tax=Glomerella acutata TaxID=27357 RepID=A0AAD8XQU2_GLOAC|nr:uncharacterized protein BDZ83DRAFT_10287 [Colletotrichum acutatum]KAK1731923.1 hypothetical protein BDZ83DRAFT_10287 [Colletotrichum acutatum]
MYNSRSLQALFVTFTLVLTARSLCPKTLAATASYMAAGTIRIRWTRRVTKVSQGKDTMPCIRKDVRRAAADHFPVASSVSGSLQDGAGVTKRLGGLSNRIFGVLQMRSPGSSLPGKQIGHGVGGHGDADLEVSESRKSSFLEVVWWRAGERHEMEQNSSSSTACGWTLPLQRLPVPFGL